MGIFVRRWWGVMLVGLACTLGCPQRGWGQQAPQVAWAQAFGSDSSDSACDVQADAQGNVYVTGYYGVSGISFGGKTLTGVGRYCDIFLAKFDAAGTHLWSKSFGGDQDDYGWGLAIDTAGNVYLTGAFHSETIQFDAITLTNRGGGGAFGTSDGYVAKISPAGDVLWAKSFGGAKTDLCRAIAIDAEDNLYFTGEYMGRIAIGGPLLDSFGLKDAFLAKWDRNGEHLWSVGFGGTRYDSGECLAIDRRQQMVYLSGNSDSETLPIAGVAHPNMALGDDVFLVKCDARGAVQWSQRMGGSEHDYARAMAIDTTGQLYLANITASDDDFRIGTTKVKNAHPGLGANALLSKFDPAGTNLWNLLIGGDDHDEAQNLAIDKNNRIYLTGRYDSTVLHAGRTQLRKETRQADAFLVRIDADANIAEMRTFGGAEYDAPAGMAVTPSGDLLLCGEYKSADFTCGPSRLSPPRDHDLWILKLAGETPPI